MNNIANGLLDSFYFFVNGNGRQWGFLLKIFAFFKVDVTILVTISVKTYSKSFLVSFYFLFYFGVVWVSSASERMLYMLIHKCQRRNSRGVFILIFMRNILNAKNGSCQLETQGNKRKEKEHKKRKKEKKNVFCYFIALSKKYFLYYLYTLWLNILKKKHPSFRAPYISFPPRFVNGINVTQV